MKLSNTNILLKTFGTEKDIQDFKNMDKYLSQTQAIQWLKKRVSQVEVDKKMLKQLKDEGRLMPDYKFNHYSKEILMNYYLETKPRK